jgi:anti-anti-sigma factor
VVTQHDTVLIVAPAHEPGSGANAIEALFDSLMTVVSEQPGARWLIDASSIATISSLAVARLISAVRQVDLAGGQIAMARVQPFVSNVLKTTRIVKVLPLFPSIPAAIAHLDGSP